MLTGDTLMAGLDLGDATVSLIRPRPVRRFHETYCGNRHLLAMYRLPAIPAAGRYLETRDKPFSPIGPAFFRPAGFRLECRGEAIDASALHCQFSEDRLTQSGISTSNWTDYQLEAALNVQTSHLFGYSSRLIAEVTNPGFGSITVVDSLLAIMLTDLARFMAVDTAAANDDGDLHERTFRILIERICDVWEVTPKVSELAELAGIGSRHLLRLFRQRQGVSLADFIRETRLEKARFMLSQTDEPIKQVAYRLGFSGQSTFTTAFRQETGLTPSAFRRQHRQRHFLSA